MGYADDLERADQSSAIVALDGLRAMGVEPFELREEGFSRLPLELLAQCWLGRHIGKNVAVYDRINVESGSATDDRYMVCANDHADRFLRARLIARDGKGSLGRRDVEQMMGNTARLFFCDLSRTDIEPCIYLARVGGYDLRACDRKAVSACNEAGDRHGEIRFAGCGRAKDDNQFGFYV